MKSFSRYSFPAVWIIFILISASTVCLAGGDFSSAIRKVMPSMVLVRSLFYHHEPDAWPSIPKHLDTRALGSGLIVDKRGFVLANAHMVVGKVDLVQVLVLNGEYLDAKIVGLDRENDLMLLKIEAPGSWDLKPVKWFRGQIKVGSWVMKGGYPSAVVSADIPSFARGIIGNTRAFLGKRSTPFGVTDTQTSEGDSGGPVFNEKGEVVGTNAFVSFGKSPVAITHFTSAEIILRSLPKLFRGDVRTGWLGINPENCIRVQDLKQDGILREQLGLFLKQHNVDMPDIEVVRGGVMIVEIANPKVGDAGLLHVGDIVTRVNGKMPQDRRELIQWIAETEPDSEINLRIIRQGSAISLHLRAGEYKWKNPRSSQNNQAP